MNKKRHYIIILATLIVLLLASNYGHANPFDAYQSIRQDWQEHGVNFEVVYTGEFFANTKGGLNRDKTYLGNTDITLTLDTQTLGLWENGTVFIYVLDNHGDKKLTGEIVGDLQTVSNIEAPRTTRVYELWYEHLFKNKTLSILLGIHDYNSEFNVTEYGSLYINSSFGIEPDISASARPSIFPLSAPALRVKYSPNNSLEWLFGVYDGDPDDPEDIEHFPRFDFDEEGGAFIANELIFYFGGEDQDLLPGFFKLGSWYNTGEFADQADTDNAGNAVVRNGNYGGYFILDKMIFKNSTGQEVGVFTQLGFAPQHLNEVDFYAGGGINIRGLIPQRTDDEFGIAVAYASISDELTETASRDRAERAIELTYSIQINDNIRIQPDLQYIMNPAAAQGTEDALVAGIRFELIM